MPATRASVEEYMSRDWDVFDRTAAEHFERVRRERGFLGMLEIGEALRQHALAQDPGWPSERERSRDLRDHLRMIALFDRIAAARAAGRR